MTDPVVPPRPAPPLPDPSWAQEYSAPVVGGAEEASGASTTTAWSDPLPASGHAGGYRSPAYDPPAYDPPAYGSTTQGDPAYRPTEYGFPADTTATRSRDLPWGATPGYPAPEASGVPAFAAPYTTPAPSGWAPPAVGPSPALGIVALVVAVVAAVGATIVGGVAAWIIGQGVGEQLGTGTVDPRLLQDLRILTPVRDTVLVGELSFYLGTALGIWAIAQGIVAIARRRGRGFGIGAVIVAPLGFLAFVTIVWIALFVGLAAGAAGSVVTT